jgi:hypothetical protein
MRNMYASLLDFATNKKNLREVANIYNGPAIPNNRTHSKAGYKSF